MKLDRHGIPAYAGMTVGDMNSIEWMDVSAKKPGTMPGLFSET
jgi:hypothetical protein